MHLPQLIQDLAVILGVAAVITFIFRRIKQPVVLGYVVSGIIVGPHTPSIFSVTDTQSIQIWAELGVIFLMFSLGLEFSFRRLGRVGMSAAATGLVQIVFMLGVGSLLAKVFDWSRMDAIFLGCMISISSTTIIIKALEELRLKSHKFAELVFGILIVEDLAAILMLVVLTNISTSSGSGVMDLLTAAGKLGLVVGAWFLIGMFLVPRFVKSVSRHGNDELLTVVSAALCLVLVAIAASFHYSIALGAFIMGSILAESREVKRIEHLMQPLRDIFGAVFFVSVGMLLDPAAITGNWGSILLVSAAIILGKLLSVTVGAFLTGQSLTNSVQTGFSMAQIGELSFIIANLGLSYKVIKPELYPIIVAASLITTFTTPYLIKFSGPLGKRLETSLPPNLRTKVESYGLWIQRRSVTRDGHVSRTTQYIKWSLNAILVIIVFLVSAEKLTPFLSTWLENDTLLRSLAWVIAFVMASPSLFAMLQTFKIPSREGQLRGSGAMLGISRAITLALLAVLSLAFFPVLTTFSVTGGLCLALFILFRRQIGGYYQWLETQFRSGFQADLESSEAGPLQKLAPWDAHLVEVKVPPRSPIAGKTLLELNLREAYGFNIVVIIRDEDTRVAPRADEIIFPGDTLLCFATDREMENFLTHIAPQGEGGFDLSSDDYAITQFRIDGESQFKGRTIRTSGIREVYNCIIVGLERAGERIRNPSSELVLKESDIVWAVGGALHLKRLTQIRALDTN